MAIRNSLCRFDPHVSLPERKRVELESQFQFLPTPFIRFFLSTPSPP